MTTILPTFRSSRPFIKELQQRSQTGDYLVMLFFVLIAAASFFAESLVATDLEHSAQATVQVMVANQIVKSLRLATDGEYRISGRQGNVLLRIRGGTAAITASECPRKFCIQQGPLGPNRGIILCVPNQLVVSIKNSTRSGLDAVTY